MKAAAYNARRRAARTGDRWWADEKRERRLARLFGGGANQFGVFVGYETEVFARVGRSHALGRLATGPAGLWVAASCCGGADWGHSSAPSVWDKAHDTRAEARLYAILHCLLDIERFADANDGTRSGAEARKMDKILRSLL
jgi:hypothetical protein